MSDMIDRLSALANEAGAEAGARLGAEDVTARLATRVRRGARRRRAVALSVTAAVVVMGAAAAVVVPQLLEPTTIDPAVVPRVPVQTNEGLITYDDGSMEVLSHSGEVVEVPAAGAVSPVFAQPSTSEACEADPSASPPGWSASFEDAFELVTFGRPLAIDGLGDEHVLVQGQQVQYDEVYKDTKVAFAVEVDPAIAPYVVMTMTAYAVDPDGTVRYYMSQLESQPTIEFVGDSGAGTYSAVATTRGMQGGIECSSNIHLVDPPATTREYLVVSVFLNDGHGQVNPIATHTSWITLVKESA